jgi:hypothetical protein
MGFSTAAAAALHVFWQAIASQQGVVVQAHPSVAGCPTVALMRNAIDRQLDPDQQETMDGWSIRTLPTNAAAVIVEVSDPPGTVRARRRVDIDGASCTAAAETVAAIAVRAFRPVEWSPPQTAVPSPAAPTIDAVATPVVRPRDGYWPRLTIAAGPAVVAGDGTGANVLIDAGVRLGGAFRLRAGGLVLPTHREESAGRMGLARLTRVVLMTGVSWSGRAGSRLQFELGPLLGLSLDSAQTEKVTAPKAGQRAILAAGAIAGVMLPLSDRWRVGLVGVLLAKVLASEFAVTTDNRETSTLRPPAISGLVALRVEGVLFP